MSPATVLSGFTGAVSRAVQAKSTTVVVQGYCGYRQRRGSGFITTPVVVQRAENQSKNRDEFINFIVRISVSDICYLSMIIKYLY